MTAVNLWDERFSGEAMMYGDAPNTFLREQAHWLAPGSRVLSLAEGEGRNGVFLASLGLEVTGVDGSAVGLAKARRLAARRGVTLHTVHADLADFEMGDSAWDGVVSIWCHLHPPTRAIVHRNIARALRPGGRLILESYHPRQLSYGTGGPPDLDKLLTLEDVLADFPGWIPRYTFEGEREVVEGVGHTGLSYVTQVVLERV